MDQLKQNREIPRGIRGEKSSGKFEEIGLNNWSISTSPKKVYNAIIWVLQPTVSNETQCARFRNQAYLFIQVKRHEQDESRTFQPE